MAWLVLVVSGILEAVWATALSKSDGLTDPGPSAVFAVALTASITGLAYAMRVLPPGTGFAAWAGIGAALTVAYAMMTGAEAASLTRVTLILGMIGCVVGLKVVN